MLHFWSNAGRTISLIPNESNYSLVYSVGDFQQPAPDNNWNAPPPAQQQQAPPQQLEPQQLPPIAPVETVDDKRKREGMSNGASTSSNPVN